MAAIVKWNEDTILSGEIGKMKEEVTLTYF